VKEVPWLLTKKERGRKKENVQKNEPATVNFQGGRKRSHRSGSIENPQSSVIYKGVLTRSLEIASALFRSPSATRQSPILRRLTALQSSLRNEFAFIVCNRVMKYPYSAWGRVLPNGTISTVLNFVCQ